MALSKSKYPLHFSPEVAQARENGLPVVALESTLIAHGMPWPQNMETGLLLEQTIRDEGAVPATIAIIKGKLCVGLQKDEMEQIAKNPDTPKVSRRDFPYILAREMNGATTVAGTMIICHMAGIRLFATGGIGGVHREAQQTFDVSADLLELGRSNVAVVSAGAKSILDLGLTLEYLETQGVPVIGYQTYDFPAFFTRSSDWQVDYRVDSAGEIAAMLDAKWSAGIDGGMLVANPIPVRYSLDPQMVEEAIQEALGDAASRGVTGKKLTPFLLSRINQLTGGLSLESNIQLVLNNARLAAEVAKALG